MNSNQRKSHISCWSYYFIELEFLNSYVVVQCRMLRCSVVDCSSAIWGAFRFFGGRVCHEKARARGPDLEVEANDGLHDDSLVHTQSIYFFHAEYRVGVDALSTHG